MERTGGRKDELNEGGWWTGTRRWTEREKKDIEALVKKLERNVIIRVLILDPKRLKK